MLAADTRESASRSLRTLRAELELLAPMYLVDAANALITSVDELRDTTPGDGDENEAVPYLLVDWIQEPLAQYHQKRSLMVQTLKHFIASDPNG